MNNLFFKIAFKDNYFLPLQKSIFTNIMCGIAGVYYFNEHPEERFSNHSEILQVLGHRGPDHQSYIELENCTLYHARLSIIDVTESSNQPFCLPSVNQTLVYNGEIFNYRLLEENAHSDMQVLYQLLHHEKENCLNKLNGFFSFGFYDNIKHTLFVARDRFGVKPLYYYSDKNKFVFASELKPLMKLAGAQELNENQLYTYFRLNYCSGQETIFKNVFRLQPGHAIHVNPEGIKISQWYQPHKEENNQDLAVLLNDSVRLRLNADVPVGSFLSGGIDSSIVSALAIKHKTDLQTFSIGFKDDHFFDESNYAELVAKHIGSNHVTFKLSEDDFLNNIDSFLRSIDEPFADSSAFNFYMLSKFTSEKVKVALSGDGADELFKGYHKHKAVRLKSDLRYRLMASIAEPILALGKSSRNSRLGNVKRRLKKFKSIQHLSDTEAFKYLASISNDREVQTLLMKHHPAYFNSLFELNNTDFGKEDLLDLKIVLADDMLVKADRFSMQHGIEIRNPFLDYRVVEFALNLKQELKINSNKQKIILHKEFSELIPKTIFERSKKGFELPLHKWLSTSLHQRLMSSWLNEDKIRSEKILNYGYITQLHTELLSDNPGDSPAKLWAIIIFESWMENFRDYIKPNA